MPFFSVVIPLYNKENYIEKTLRGVLSQTFSDIEIIVVNDGSTDGSLTKAEAVKDERIKLVDQKNQGVSIARNNGISLAEAEYIALLDADDLWYPDHLKELKNLISKFPKAGLYCTGYEVFLGNGIIRPAVYSTVISEKMQLVPDYFSASLVNPVAWTSAVAFSKKDFHKIGEFNPRLRTAQDLDFFIRAALKKPIALNPKITMHYHKISENNLAKSDYHEDRLLLHKLHEDAERNNLSLKKYMDFNRYALAIRLKLQKDPIWKNLVDEIDSGNLNAKQRFLLKMPKVFLQGAKKFQQKLMKTGVYWTAFK